MKNMLKSAPAETIGSTYKVGESDSRPWGYYIVTGVGTNAAGEEYCEKTITVKPWQILSLQSHALRRETWTVRKGTLTALRDDQRIEISPGESLHIPAGSLHCMANMSEDDCIVDERQEGICREEDIRRYMDAYQRDTEALVPPSAEESFAVYQAILSDKEKKNERRGGLINKKLLFLASILLPLLCMRQAAAALPDMPQHTIVSAQETESPVRVKPGKSQIVHLDEEVGRVQVDEKPSQVTALINDSRSIVLFPHSVNGTAHITVFGRDGKPIMARYVIISDPAQKYIHLHKTCKEGNDAACDKDVVYFCPNICYEATIVSALK